MMLTPPARLLKVWRFVRWLDQARWHAMELNLIPGRVFAALTPDQKVLTHWLCYITDQQRPFMQAWEQGGPVLAEIVRAYARTKNNAIEIIQKFAEPAPDRSGVDRLTAKAQLADNKRPSLTPRYGMHLLSIAATLAALDEYNCERSRAGLQSAKRRAGVARRGRRK